MTKKRLILLGAVMLFVAMAACAKKSKSERASEWHGLSEDEVRSKLDAKLPHKIPAEKRAAISDKIVTKMRDKGAIDDSVSVPDDASAITDDAEPLAQN